MTASGSLHRAGADDRRNPLLRRAFALEYISGGKTNISGPVKVPPINDITTSNRGTDSPTATARATTADLIAQRFQPKAVKEKIMFLSYLLHLIDKKKSTYIFELSADPQDVEKAQNVR